MKRILAICMLFVAAPLMVQAKPTPYSDPQNGFRLTPPDGWNSAPSVAKKVNAKACFMGPMQSSDFRANINIMVQAMGDLEKFNSISVEQIKSSGGTIVSQKKIKLPSGPGYQVIWKATMNGRPLEFNSTYTCGKGQTVLFTGTSLESKWNDVSGLLDKSAMTLSAP